MENIFILSISVLILWLHLGWVSCQQKVEQTQFLRVQEGDSATLNCNYTDSIASYFLWYHQSPGKGPVLRIAGYSSGDEEGRFTISVNKEAKQFSLHISASQPVDSGTYFCAAVTQCSLGPCSQCINPAAGATDLVCHQTDPEAENFIILFLFAKEKIKKGSEGAM
uniref:Ig-like domain-containing protein n=1 Tax=Vombatus ursinus TaxID=29139 RepID=A0A4X2LY73_VOMUR